MNNIPKNAAANHSPNTQRTEDMSPGAGRPVATVTGAGQQRPAVTAAGEIGTQAARQGVYFGSSNNEHVQEQIRIYIPGSPVTEGLEEGDQRGALVTLLRELRAVIAQTPALATDAAPNRPQRRNSPPPSQSRWAPSSTPISTPISSEKITDSAPAQPKRTTDAAPSMPRRNTG